MVFTISSNEAIQALNIERIAQHMRETNWKWMNEVTNYESRVPTEREITEFVTGCLASCDEIDGTEYTIQSGGFTFRRRDDVYEITFNFGE